MQALALLKNLNVDCKMKNLNHYPVLAEIFMYPTEHLNKRIHKWKEIVKEYDPLLCVKLEQFAEYITEKPLSRQQEYYTATFDIQPICTLDVGYVLFGDDYRRGVFLVNMKKEHIKAGNSCGSELPDHLPNILTLLPLLSDNELAEELVYSLLIPAVTGMISKFRDIENHYKGLLEILLEIMNMDYPVSSFERFQFNVKTSQKI